MDFKKIKIKWSENIIFSKTIYIYIQKHSFSNILGLRFFFKD